MTTLSYHKDIVNVKREDMLLMGFQETMLAGLADHRELLTEALTSNSSCYY